MIDYKQGENRILHFAVILLVMDFFFEIAVESGSLGELISKAEQCVLFNIHLIIGASD